MNKRKRLQSGLCGRVLDARRGDAQRIRLVQEWLIFTQGSGLRPDEQPNNTAKGTNTQPTPSCDPKTMFLSRIPSAWKRLDRITEAVTTPTEPPLAKTSASRTGDEPYLSDAMSGRLHSRHWLFQLFWNEKTYDAQAPVF